MSSSTAVYGQSVTFTATVSPVAPGSGTPTGAVTFLDGSKTLGTGLLSGGVASFTTSALALGTHSITATYGGDGNFTPSTATALGQTVTKDGTTAVITSSVNPSVLHQSISFTVAVSAAAPGSGTPTGTVQFQIDGANFGPAVALVNGNATSGSISSLTVGNHNVTAIYGGDANFASTAPALTQLVQKDATTTNLVVSVNPSVYGQLVTFTATVAPVAPGSGTPTGTVTFKDGGTTLGTANLNTAGKAIFSTTKLATGKHAITAVYNGNSTLALSTSATLNQAVNPRR